MHWHRYSLRLVTPSPGANRNLSGCSVMRLIQTVKKNYWFSVTVSNVPGGGEAFDKMQRYTDGLCI
jgi:hypothetical protein